MKTIIQLFKELFKGFPWHFLMLFALVFSQTLLNTLSVIAIAPITDLLLEHSIENSSKITQYFVEVLYTFGWELSLLSVCIFFGSVTLLNGVTAIVSQYALLRIKYDILIHLLSDTIGVFFRARFLFFSQSKMGVLLNSFQQEVTKIGDTFGQIAQFLANLVQVIIFMVVPFILNPKLTLIFIVIIILIGSPILFIRGLSYGMGKRNTETANVAAGILHETLNSAKLVLGFGRQENAVHRYHDSIIEHSKISVTFQTLQRGVGILFTPLGITAALVALYIAFLDNTPFSEMTMVLFALVRLMPIISQIAQSKTNIEGFSPAYEQLQKLRKEALKLEEPKGGTEFKKLNYGLYLKNVSYSYPFRKPALDNVNVSILKGKTTAFVGKSGSGKTTLVDLILGLHRKDTGKILLDRKEIDLYNLNSFRNRVGYVPQEPQLFNSTVRENLLWSSPKASEKEIWHACQKANAEEFVHELPEKLDTTLGDRGVRLSGGQRQRLALARAIIRNPDLLILDEATSSLDTESEQLIQESIDDLSGNMTIVVIAHRLSTIRNADYIYVLDRGKIIEEGPYKELKNKSGSTLSTMINTQR